MTWSRFAALALAVPLLHLNIVRADSACDQHSGASQPAAEMPSGDMAAHHHPAPAETPDPSCDTPVQVECCQAVVSCSPGLGELITTVDAGPRAVSVVAAQSFVMPLSRVTPPEPPPPRA